MLSFCGSVLRWAAIDGKQSLVLRRVLGLGGSFLAIWISDRWGTKGPLVVGKDGRSLQINLAAADCIIDRMPGGTMPRKLRNIGNATLDPNASIEDFSATDFDVEVGPSTEPSWLILEQSWNEGWTATIAAGDGDGGTHDLGAPVLINGYANGWILPTSETARAVHLEWKPQRVVRLALWASLIAGIGIVALAVFSRRPPRVDSDLARRRDRAAARKRSPLLAILLVALIGFLAGPIVAVWAAVTLVVAQRVRWFALATVLVAGSIVAGSIVALEWRHDYPLGPDWPDRFGWTSPLVWIAVATVVVSAIMPLGVRAAVRDQTDVAETQAS